MTFVYYYYSYYRNNYVAVFAPRAHILST